MTAKEIQGLVESLNYWDARVTSLNCNHFADEIELTYDIEEHSVVYKFIGCYKSLFNHHKGYDKCIPVREMRLAQIPYFMQDIEIDEVLVEDIVFYTCKINMYPLSLEICCKDIKIITQKSM